MLAMIISAFNAVTRIIVDARQLQLVMQRRYPSQPE